MTHEDFVDQGARWRAGVKSGKSMTWLVLAMAFLAVGPARALPADPHTPSGSSQDVEPSKLNPPVTLVGQTPAQEELVGEVVALFAEAGLELPPLKITFFPGRQHCDGMGGWHRGIGVIEICMATERMIAHEIAHAWEAHNLTDADREGYRQLWDAPTWGSHEFSWHERAIELAANTVAFAVLNDDPEPYQQILMYVCTFEVLTGRPLPTPLVSPCPPARLPGQASQ